MIKNDQVSLKLKEKSQVSGGYLFLNPIIKNQRFLLEQMVNWLTGFLICWEQEKVVTLFLPSLNGRMNILEC